MTTQRLVWTLLPNGLRNSRRARASVLISPRLTLSPEATPPDLRHFPAFHDWPTTIADGRFKVLVNGSASVNADIVSAPDSSVWKAIFPKSTFVRPWKFDDAGLTDKVILSSPASAIAALVEALYGGMAISAREGLPKRSVLANFINGPGGDQGAAYILDRPGVSRIRPKPLTPEQVLDRLRADQRAMKDPMLLADPAALAAHGLMADRSQALDLLQAYHTPLQTPKRVKAPADHLPEGYAEKFPGEPNPTQDAAWLTHEQAPLAGEEDFKTLVDFHQIASALCQHPEIMRLCGLVVELEFDRPPPGPAVTLELLPPLSPAGAQDIFPKVVVNNAGEIFCAARRNAASPIIDRYLNLSDANYSLLQMDVDGAGMKLKNLSESLSRELPDEFDDEDFEDRDDEDPEAGEAGRKRGRIEAEAGLPALRTGGVMLAERRRDLSLSALFRNASSMQSQIEAAHTPPTLYAEDVIRGYRVDVLNRDLGKWRSLFFRKTDYRFKNTGGGLSIPIEEGMARLAAASSADGNNADILKINEALANWTGWSLAAPEPGRLVGFDDEAAADRVADEEETTPPGLPLETTYSAVPGTLPRLRFGRTYRLRVRLVDLAGTSEPFTEDYERPAGAESAWLTYRRHEPVEPPALALVRDGTAIDPVDEGESMQRLAIRTWNDVEEKNAIPTGQTARRHVIPARVSHRFAETHGVMDTGPGGTLDPSLYALLVSKDKALDDIAIDRGKAEGTGSPERYACADKDFELPYLPDPLAVGAAIRVVGAAGVDDSRIHRFSLYTDGVEWPHASPFKIVIREPAAPSGASAAPDARFDEKTREFCIPLMKAERARVYISCIIPKSAIGMMAVREMAAGLKPEAAVAEDIDSQIRAGQHWMFTPWRVVEIVHAVQKPLVTPQITNLTIGRTLGDAVAAPEIQELPLHAKSTAHVDMEGEWREPVDDPGDLQAAEAPYSRMEKAHAFSRKISRNETPYDNYPLFTGKHSFANTSYRRVSYALHATTRYREYFEPEIRNDESQLKVTSAKRIGWVPNAAPPPPPKVLYVIPTFGWERTRDDDSATSLRAGGGLRVYLNRPWMTTGFTEMLGVVLPHGATDPTVWNDDLEARYAGSVTMWGADPLLAGAEKIQTAAPPFSAFPLARTEPPITFDGSGLPVEEGTDLPSGPFLHRGLAHPQANQIGSDAKTNLFDVAPHIVGFDAERKLWYSDIVIRPPRGVYFPFVRLALARYNPISVDGAHLSAAVITEFQQLVADRLVIVTKSAGSAHVAVHGTAGESNAGSPSAGRFEALIQILDAGGDPDLDWRTVTEPEAPAPAFAARARADVTRKNPSLPRPAVKLETRRKPQPADAKALTFQPDLAKALRPPLIWKNDVRLPQTPNGGRRRILIVEREYYSRQDDDLGVTPQTPRVGGRIVYMETLDV